MKELTEYIDYVLAHKELHAEKTVKSIERVQRLIDAGTKYDGKEVAAVIRFAEKLVADEGGKRLKLMPWQKFFIAAIYGFRHADGSVVFNDAFLFIAKKNGKTSLAAALALYNLLTIPAAQVILVAADYEQAKIAFAAITKYIRNTPILKTALDDHEIFIRESPPLTVAYYPLGSAIMIKPETRAKSAQGFNATFALFDEIASYRSGEIINKIASGMVKTGAIRVAITTAETTMNSPGYTEYERAKQLLDGRYEASNYLPLIYELDKNDDKFDDTKYVKANPALDIIKPLRKLIEERDRAKQNPVDEAAFFAYQLNLWSANTQADIADSDWISAVENYEKYKSYLDDEKLKTYPCCGAIDLSKSDDYTAYTMAFYIRPIGKYYLRHKFYIPAAMLEKRVRLETEELALWVSRGLVTPTRNNEGDAVINCGYLIRDVIADIETYRPLSIGYDVAHGMKFLRRMNEEAPNHPLVPFAQNWKKICPANRHFLDLIYQKKLIDNNPVMRWMVGCVKINIDRLGNVYFEKANYRQSNLRIDAVDTSVMALGLLDAALEDAPPAEEDVAKAIGEIDY